MSKQLVHARLLHSRIVAWPGREPWTSQPESQPINHYKTMPLNLSPVSLTI